MVNDSYAESRQTVFQIDESIVEAVKKLRDDALDFCTRHIGRYVRIKTITGQVVEGTIVHVDPRHVYLRISHGQGYAYTHRPVNPYFYGNNAILPLVLYELLVITLLS